MQRNQGRTGRRRRCVSMCVCATDTRRDGWSLDMYQKFSHHVCAAVLAMQIVTCQPNDSTSHPPHAMRKSLHCRPTSPFGLALSVYI
ncbi:hypothetical protein SORBI_3003G377650 [Sorghum bicolor]|uniref:Uncharacterized protein n=1 Tax=Sorghum bicolor TaxID=4558 RepID=A0A1W0W0W2_SORBI|nr:hypothetical protein SORBI_3003G377650 [Sorghum bicolor]